MNLLIIGGLLLVGGLAILGAVLLGVSEQRAEVARRNPEPLATLPANGNPTVACELLREGAARAVRAVKTMRPPEFTLPVSLEITFLVADMAEMASTPCASKRSRLNSALAHCLS